MERVYVIIYLGVFVAVFSIILRYVGGLVLDYFYHRLKWKTPINRSEFVVINRYLEQHSSYYKRMSLNGKAKFLNRVVQFINDKNFIGRNGLEITLEIKTVIAGSAVQLTFGLEDYLFPFISNINVYPEDFYLKLIEKKLKGGTSEGGTMFFSWKDVSSGFQTEDDKINLGLHEFAHALKIEASNDNGFNHNFNKNLNKLEQIGATEFNNIRNGSPSFLRKYAGTNNQEFFAVCVEHFFEAPEDFANELPDVYDQLRTLLNQDPGNSRMEYALNQSLTKASHKKGVEYFEKMIVKDLSRAPWHWSLNVLLFGLFFGSWLSLIMSQHLFIGLRDILYINAVTIVAGSITQYKEIVQSNFMSPIMFIVYLVLGFTPTALFVVFFLTSITTIKESEITYKVIHKNRSATEYRFYTTETKLNNKPDITRYKYSALNYDEYLGADSLRVTFAKSITLLTKVRDVEIIFKN